VFGSTQLMLSNGTKGRYSPAFRTLSTLPWTSTKARKSRLDRSYRQANVLLSGSWKTKAPLGFLGAPSGAVNPNEQAVRSPLQREHGVAGWVYRSHGASQSPATRSSFSPRCSRSAATSSEAGNRFRFRTGQNSQSSNNGSSWRLRLPTSRTISPPCRRISASSWGASRED
jgi:hypothetical protein